MEEGRYLVGATSAEATQAFLREQAGLEVPLEVLRARAQAAARRREALEAEAGGPWQPAPVPRDWEPHLERVARRPLFQRLFGPRAWRFAAVPVQRLLTVQPYVHWTFALRRAAAAATAADLLAFCLPAEPEHLELWGGVTAGDGAEPPAASFWTRDPNVRVSAAWVETEPRLRVTFEIGKTAVFVQVTAVGDRLYLRDGTHRALGLAAHGWQWVPCVLVPADDAADLPRILPAAALRGPHPPRLAEFLDPACFVAFPWVERVKGIRLVAEEFAAPLLPSGRGLGGASPEGVGLRGEEPRRPRAEQAEGPAGEVG